MIIQAVFIDLKLAQKPTCLKETELGVILSFSPLLFLKGLEQYVLYCQMIEVK